MSSATMRFLFSFGISLSRFSSRHAQGEAVGIAQVDVLVLARELSERRGIGLDEARRRASAPIARRARA